MSLCVINVHVGVSTVHTHTVQSKRGQSFFTPPISAHADTLIQPI